MGPVGYGFDHLTSTRVGDSPCPPRDAPRSAESAGSEVAPDDPGASSSAATNSARTPDCPGCLFLREQVDILVSTRGELIAANFALAARANAAEVEIGRRVAAERRTAEMLLGLAGLQKAPGA